MKFSILAVFLIVLSKSSFGCDNFLPESEIIKAVNGTSTPPAKLCSQLPLEPCICFEGTDWRIVDYDSVNKRLVINPTKKAAVDAANAAAEQARANRASAIAALKSTDISTMNLGQLINYLKVALPYLYENVK